MLAFLLLGLLGLLGPLGWRCSCGEFNPDNTFCCRKCGASR